jgi:fructose transport system permease protein
MPNVKNSETSVNFEAGLETASAHEPQFEDTSPTLLRRLQHFLHSYPTTAPVAVLLLSVVAFSIAAGGTFMAAFNLSIVFQQVTIVAVLGIAQTLIILTAGIDLSVGAIMVLCSVIMGRTAVVYGVPVEIAFSLALLAGLVCGLVNGVLVTLFRLPPFIVTLGTWSMFGALNIYYSHSETIRQKEIEEFAPFLQWPGTSIRPYNLLSEHLGLVVPWLKGSVITTGSLMMILIAIGVWFLLQRTAFGRHVYATGDDREAARLAGINTTRTLVVVYALAGLICAIAAWILIGRIGSISPQAGGTSNLDSITAVVIGGTSLFGGRGTVAGTLVGALIVGVFRNGLSLSGLDVLWQEFAIGLLIIFAVSLDQWIRRISA